MTAAWPARSCMVLAMGVVLSALPLAAVSAQTKPVDPEEARQLREAQSRQLEDKKRREKEIVADAAAIREERERLNARLLESAGQIQASEGQMTLIEQRLGELGVQENLLRGSLEQQHGSIAKLLSAMQRMGRNPPPVMITRREDALSMVRSAMLLASAFPELRGRALALADQLNSLVQVINNARAESDRFKVETTRLADARTRLAGLMESKKQSLAERQAELAEVRKAAADISKNVEKIDELIAKLGKTVADRTRLGAYEKKLQAEAAKEKELATAEPPAAPVPLPEPLATPAKPAEPGVPAAPAQPPPKQVAGLLPPSAPSSPSVVIDPLNEPLKPFGRIEPQFPFHTARGRLPLPVQGRRTLAFGDRTQSGGRSNGIVIETRHGAQVVAPNDGWVMYAGEFRSYGQILIINGGGGYNVLLANMSQIDVQAGQFVLSGEPVGTMASQPKTTGTSPKAPQENAPILYVEFKKDGKSIDPDPWWSEGSRKVQG